MSNLQQTPAIEPHAVIGPVADPSLAFATRLPRWQVLTVLVGFPAVYIANGFTPWSLGLFLHGDRSYYVAFWISILTLHWLSLAITLAFVARAGGRWEDIGLKLRPTKTLMAVGIVAAAGACMLWLRTTWPAATEPPKDWQILYPFTMAERWLVLFGACTAGICEEIIYRGFAIRVLQGRGFRTWHAVLLAGLVFALIHGITGIILLPVFIVIAIVYGAAFLWCRSLLPLIVVHILWDMMMVLAI